MSAGAEQSLTVNLNSGRERLENLRKELSGIAKSARQVLMALRVEARGEERRQSELKIRLREMERDPTYSIRPPEIKKNLLRELQSALQQSREHAENCKETAAALFEISGALYETEAKLREYGAIETELYMEAKREGSMVKIFEQAYDGLEQIKELRGNFRGAFSPNPLNALPADAIARARETLDRLRRGVYRPILKAEVEKANALTPDMQKVGHALEKIANQKVHNDNTLNLEDKISQIFYSRCITGGVFNWFLRANEYELIDELNEMNSPLSSCTQIFYRSIISSNANYLKQNPNQWHVINIPYQNAAAKEAFQFIDNKWLQTSMKVFVSGTIEGKYENGRVYYRNINTYWEWKDEIDANSFPGIAWLKGESKTVFDNEDPLIKAFIEGCWDILGDTIWDTDFWVTIKWQYQMFHEQRADG